MIIVPFLLLIFVYLFMLIFVAFAMTAIMATVFLFRSMLNVELLAVSTFSERGLAEDTLLGVLAHSMLAIGLLSVSLLSGVRVDLMAYLVGDILAVSKQDLALIWGGDLTVVALIAWRWHALLTSTLSPDLAQASGINARREQLVLTITLAIVVAVAIRNEDCSIIACVH